MYPIEFEDIECRYQQVPVINHISHQIPADKITVLLGPSGSGKSTLLQTINGLIKPTQGHVKVFGEPLNYDELISLRLQIGYSVQGSALFPHLTARQNIALMAKTLRYQKDWIEQRISQLCQVMKIESALLERFPHQLSGGQQQRVGLCRALLLDPKIVLLDEAFTALDAITRQGIQSELLSFQRQSPKTIVMVTHDLEEAMLMADELLILNQKKLVFCHTMLPSTDKIALRKEVIDWLV